MRWAKANCQHSEVIAAGIEAPMSASNAQGQEKLLFSIAQSHRNRMRWEIIHGEVNPGVPTAEVRIDVCPARSCNVIAGVVRCDDMRIRLHRNVTTITKPACSEGNGTLFDPAYYPLLPKNYGSKVPMPKTIGMMPSKTRMFKKKITRRLRILGRLTRKC